jgi:general secretion pathway protein N
MAGDEIMRRLAVGLALLVLSAHGAIASTPSSSDALDKDLTDDIKSAGPPVVVPAAAEPVTTVRVVAPPPAPVRTPSANPLWGIPLTQLSGTRDRPIFSPSRRPPPAAVAAEPAVVRPPPRKKEIEPPQLALVGTIASGAEGFGIFIDQSTKAALRLKVGEDFQGWKLLTIRGREVAMSKDGRSAVLTLPQPGGQDGEVRLVPVSAVTQR